MDSEIKGLQFFTKCFVLRISNFWPILVFTPIMTWISQVLNEFEPSLIILMQRIVKAFKFLSIDGDRKKWTCWALCGPFLFSVQTRLGHGRSRAWIPWPGGHVGRWRRQWERSRRSSSPRSPSGGRQVWLLTKRTVLSYLDWVTTALDEGDACQLHLPKWWQHDGSTVEALELKDTLQKIWATIFYF